LAASEEKVTPLADDKSKVYLEGTSNRQCLQDGTKVYRQLFSADLVISGVMAERLLSQPL